MAQTRWLPRGAMDLNTKETGLNFTLLGWLPRGAMDLNKYQIGKTYEEEVGSLVEPWI